jgi:dTDP-4-amino-4,6-dideoxygalactose transaminase
MISVFGSKVGREELIEIQSSLENQWMGIGPKTHQFEEAFSKRLNLPSFTLLNSCSNALLMAVRLLDLPKDSEVILPSFTWISCAHSILLAGLKPVFCDVDLYTQNVTLETIEPCITKNTRALMVVHYAGKPVRMETLTGLGLPIIEDAAHAVDSKLGDQYCGGIGDIGVYSFDAIKNLPMPEGGGITAKNPVHYKQTPDLRYCGIGKSGFEVAQTKSVRWWEYHIHDIYPKLIPNDICVSVGLAQLKKLDLHQKLRKKIWDLYQEMFKDVSWLILPKNPEPDEQHSYFTYCVQLTNGKRDEFANYLLDKGIYSTLRYHPLHLNPIYQSTAKLPNCEQLNETALNLPLHPNLSDADVQKVIATIKDFG